MAAEADPTKLLELAKDLENLADKPSLSKGTKSDPVSADRKNGAAAMAKNPSKPAVAGEGPKADLIDADKVVLPASAEAVAIDPAAQTIQYVAKEPVDDQRTFFRSTYDKLGWHSSSTSTSIINGQKNVTMRLYKNDLELCFEMAAEKPAGKNTTTISGKGLRFKPGVDFGNGDGTTKPLVKREGLEAKDVNGLPIPAGCGSNTYESSPYRCFLETSTAVDLAAIVTFYTKELADRGWKPGRGVKVETERAHLPFVSASGEELTATLAQAGKDVQIKLLVRRPELIAKSGLLGADGKARLLIGNQYAGDAVVTINGKPYPIAKGVGAEDPSTAVKVQLFPGTNQLVIKIPGKSDVARELPVNAGEVWGLMILENGNVMPIQMY